MRNISIDELKINQNFDLYYTLYLYQKLNNIVLSEKVGINNTYKPYLTFGL